MCIRDRIVTRKDSGIKNVADMAGKNICVGAVGSGYEVAARQILGAYGMSYDDINETFADQSTACLLYTSDIAEPALQVSGQRKI